MPRLPKGSAEAKERMAHLRSLRKKKGKGIEPETPVAPESPVSEKGEGMTPWIKHVNAFAKKNNMNYFQALKDPKVKVGYTKK